MNEFAEIKARLAARAAARVKMVLDWAETHSNGWVFARPEGGNVMVAATCLTTGAVLSVELLEGQAQLLGKVFAVEGYSDPEDNEERLIHLGVFDWERVAEIDRERPIHWQFGHCQVARVGVLSK